MNGIRMKANKCILNQLSWSYTIHSVSLSVPGKELDMFQVSQVEVGPEIDT